jgi:hypothetical protein
VPQGEVAVIGLVIADNHSGHTHRITRTRQHVRLDLFERLDRRLAGHKVAQPVARSDMVRSVFADLGCHEPQRVHLAVQRTEYLACPLLASLIEVGNDDDGAAEQRAGVDLFEVAGAHRRRGSYDAERLHRMYVLLAFDKINRRASSDSLTHP